MGYKHTLQRLDSPARSLSFILHLAGIGSCIACFFYLNQTPQMPGDSMGGNFQFLTVLGLALSLATFTVGYAADLLLSRELFELRNRLAVCAAPLEVLISTLYWGIRAIDSSLVVPPGVFIPLPLDLGLHAAPAVFFSIEFLLFSPPWTIHASSAMALSLVLAFLYWGWVEFCFSYNHFYPYPLFELLSTAQRATLFVAAASLMTLSTMAMKQVYRLVNGSEVAPIKKD